MNGDVSSMEGNLKVYQTFANIVGNGQAKVPLESYVTERRGTASIQASLHLRCTGSDPDFEELDISPSPERHTSKRDG